MTNYCMKCMKELGCSPICPNCGRDNGKPPVAEPYHLKPGTLLCGRYLVGEAIGEGGFGITYIGLHTTLSKRVAIKEFYPSGAANRTNGVSDNIIITKDKQSFFSKGVERFLQEAKNIAAFPDEDGIVDVIDYFQENNTAYIVMEYLDGLTLKQYTEKYGLFDFEKLFELMRPMIKSLGVIHSHGVVHRDISPDNIMYSKNGKLKLMDFGSARFYTNEDRQMSVILKQGFAPEEQYRANGVQGPYTDIYALCATIYTCITGRIPVSSLDRLSQDTLAWPSQLGVPIKPYQERALMHGLAVRASERTPNVEALLREMSAAQSPNNQFANPVAAVPQASVPPVAFSKVDSRFTTNNHTPMREPDAWQQNTGFGNTHNTQNPGNQQYTPQNRGQQFSPNQNPLPRNYSNQNPSYQGYVNQNPRQHTVPPASSKKSRLPVILGITISITVVAAIAVILTIVFSGGKKSSGVSSNSYSSGVSRSSVSGYSSAQSSKSASSKTQSSRAQSSKTQSSRAESSKTESVTVGFSAQDAVKYSDQIVECIQPKIADEDYKASSGDKIEIQKGYYVSKNDGTYNRIVFVYYNATAGYYQTIMISPENLKVSGGKVEYESIYFSLGNAANTQQKAIENQWLLNISDSDYTITEIL